MIFIPLLALRDHPSFCAFGQEPCPARPLVKRAESRFPSSHSLHSPPGQIGPSDPVIGPYGLGVPASTQACFFTPAACSKYCFTAGIQDAKEASETTSGCAPGFLPAPPNICSANAGPRFGYKPNSKLVARVWKAHLDWAEGVEALEISASSGQVLVVLALI